MSDDYKFVREDFDDAEVLYKFTHDRILQAVYSMIDDTQKKKISPANWQNIIAKCH